MIRHVYIHLHDIVAAASSEVHWHVYAEPISQASKNPDTDIQDVNIINPPNNSPWNVRPPVPGSTSPGYICADGNALVGGEPANSVWAYIFDHVPSFAELQTIPTGPSGAVCGKIDSRTGDWVFRHDTPPCTAGPTGLPGQLGTEIPRARHSPAITGGTSNWLAVWGVKGTQKNVDVHRFFGITSTTTSCGGGAVSGGVMAGPMAEPAGLPPLPSEFLAHFKLSPGKPGSVRLQYAPHASQSHQPVWLSECARWRLSVEMIEDSLLAQLDGRWPVNDDKLHARWSGILSPEKARNKLQALAPAKLLNQLSPVELEGTK